MNDESDIKTIENANASTSILEVPPFIKNYNQLDQLENEPSLIPNINEKNKHEYGNTNLFTIDPIFIPYTFHLPKALFNLAKKAENCAFKFILSSSEILKVQSENFSQSFNVYEYGENINFSSDSIFIHNKKKFIRKFHSKENKEFKKSVEEKEKYTQSDLLAEYKEFLYHNQIIHKCNIFYVEDYEDLLSIFKVLVSEKKENTIKTKKFGNEKQKERLEYILNNIPGLGKNVAKSMCLRFMSISDFVCGLNDMKEEDFVDLPVILDDGISTRNLGQKQYLIMKNVFLSLDPNKRVIKN